MSALRTSTALLQFVLLLVLPSARVAAQPAPATPNRLLVIRNATVIDMRSDRPQSNMTVVVSGNRITALRRGGTIPDGADVVDATGKYLIPGLWDSYTFALDLAKLAPPVFPLLVAHGVTGVRDGGTSMSLADAARLRADAEAGRSLVPRLYVAGPTLVGRRPTRATYRANANALVVETPEDTRAAVDSLARAGVDHIKAEKSLPPELLRAAIAAAHVARLPVVAVPQSFVLDASRDGVDCVEHIVEVQRTTSKQRDQYYEMARRGSGVSIDEEYAFIGAMERDEPYYAETLATMARNGTCVVTNFSQFDSFIGDYELADTTRRRFKTKGLLRLMQARLADRERWLRTDDMRIRESTRQRQLQHIRDLQGAGVRILAGTQTAAGALGTPGLMMHDELALLVRAGLSPFEALKTATVNPAVFMRREKELGTIERGKLADLVLLDADPLADIANTRKISGVVLNGRYLPRVALDSILSDVETWVRAH